uniref:NADH-ubiquinone oxidoreductase chain 2 n=1 Tax=Trapelus mutabilis pallidus TaxID=311450 RepID=C6KTG3_9SAUR|nr:NADH dehydrogenase subunit 2 [Trapelus mutabilis pallidus]
MAQMLTTTSIILGTMMVIMSHHWLMVWIGLEINMLAILPMISKTKTIRSTEATTKYFLTQAIASIMLLMASTTNSWQTGTWDITQISNTYSSTIIILALATKMGSAPFHFWLPETLQGSSMKTALIISSCPKIAPKDIMYMISNNTQTTALMLMGVLSMLVGGLGGINQTQMRKMMAYSSISNTGWTILTMAISPNIAMFNLLIYIIMITPMFIAMATTSTMTLQDISTMWTTSPTLTYLMTLLMLSTSGLPPLTGFMPKLIMLNELINQELVILSTATALITLINLLFYMRIAYLSAMLTPPTTSPSMMKWRPQIKQSNLTTMLIPTALLSLLTIPAIPN